MDKPQELGRIQKNKSTWILVQLTHFKENAYLDIREYFTNAQGELTPTKKGISIPIGQASQVLTLIENAERIYVGSPGL